MTKEELLQKLADIEWDDFECKASQNKLSEDVWSTVSAFSNTSGGWVVFGIKQEGKKFGLQNPGRFMFPLSELRTQIHSIPRNPNIIKFFRYAKLGENAGYGIDKMLAWEQLTKGKVEFASDLVSSTITYRVGEQVSGQVSVQVGGTEQAIKQPVTRVDGTGNGISNGTSSDQVSGQVGGQVSGQVQTLIDTIRERAFSIIDLQKRLGIKSRRYVREEMIVPAIEGGYVLLAYPEKPNHPQQRYYLSEKGLKLVK